MWTVEEYENFVYTISDSSPYIKSINLVLQRRGMYYCRLIGTVFFTKNLRLEVTEVLDFAVSSFIRYYSYSIFRANKRLYWYDSQGHPNDPNLKATHPHHKHIPPDIKHNRIPAPEISFKKPNLPFLIREIEKQFFPLV